VECKTILERAYPTLGPLGLFFRALCGAAFCRKQSAKGGQIPSPRAEKEKRIDAGAPWTRKTPRADRCTRLFFPFPWAWRDWARPLVNRIIPYFPAIVFFPFIRWAFWVPADDQSDGGPFPTLGKEPSPDRWMIVSLMFGCPLGAPGGFIGVQQRTRKAAKTG